MTRDSSGSGIFNSTGDVTGRTRPFSRAQGSLAEVRCGHAQSDLSVFETRQPVHHRAGGAILRTSASQRSGTQGCMALRGRFRQVTFDICRRGPGIAFMTFPSPRSSGVLPDEELNHGRINFIAACPEISGQEISVTFNATFRRNSMPDTSEIEIVGNERVIYLLPEPQKSSVKGVYYGVEDEIDRLVGCGSAQKKLVRDGDPASLCGTGVPEPRHREDSHQKGLQGVGSRSRGRHGARGERLFPSGLPSQRVQRIDDFVNPDTSNLLLLLRKLKPQGYLGGGEDETSGS